MEEIIATPRGIEVLIRFVSSLPGSILRDEKIGSGLFNTILNKFKGKK